MLFFRYPPIFPKLLVLLLCFFAPAIRQVQAQPIVPNAGFEQGGSNPTGWSHSTSDGGTGTVEVETKVVHSGSRAWRVDKTNPVGFSMLLSDFIPVEAGKEYEAQAWVYVPARSRAGVYFMVTQYGADSDQMRTPNAFSPSQIIYDLGRWVPLKIRFTAREGSTRARVHALITQAPTSIIWDDFTVHEVGAEIKEPYNPRYVKPEPEPLPPLEPAMERLKQRPRAHAERRIVNGRPRFFIDGKPVEPTFYVSPFQLSDQPEVPQSQIADFKKAGVRVYFVPLVLGRSLYTNNERGPWIGKEKTDFSKIDNLLWRVLRVDPDAYVMFYMACDPYVEWGVEHPDEVCTDQDGKKAIAEMHPKDWGREPTGPRERYAPSLVSSVLRADTSKVLTGLAQHVENSLPGKAVIGYHVAGFNDGMWVQWTGVDAAGQRHLADYSPAGQRAFRDWLRRKYESEDALRRAWHQPQATFEETAVPPGARRLAPGFFLDVVRDADLIDFNRFYSESVLETITGYARVLKGETKNRILISTYYPGAANNVDGSLATAKMLQTPDIDFTIGVAEYGAVRRVGGQGKADGMWGSLALGGRIYLHEQDFRSWLTGVGGSSAENDLHVGRASNAAEHNAMVARDSGMMLAFGHGTWWYDMGGGWFHDPGIMHGVAQARKAFTRDLAKPGSLRADVAVFIDEAGLNYLADSTMGPYRYQAIAGQLKVMNLAGVPYHVYLQSDITNKKLPPYKLYLFLNPQHIAQNELAAIKALRRDKKTFCFVHAPGVIGAPDASRAIEDVTGIKVKALEGTRALYVNPLPQISGTGSTNSNDPLALNEMITFGGLNGPAFSPADPQARVIGIYTDGTPAAATRDFGTWKSIFLGGPGLTEPFLNAIARYAGAWVAAEAGDAVYANQYFMTVHALWDGEKKLTLSGPSRVTDWTTGKLISPLTKTLAIPMKRGETRWFALQPNTTSIKR